MAKSLKDILAGVKSSKKEKLDLSNIHDYHSKDGEDFIAKHEIEKHADRVGNGDEVYKGKTKEADYKKQSKGVYEEASCNHTNEGTYCEMHGDKTCPDYNDDKKGKSKKLLLDKKKNVEEGIRPMGRTDSAYKDNPRRLSNEYPKSFKQPGTPSKSDLRSIVNKAISGKSITKLPPGKAKGIKEEYIEEKLTAKNPASKWIHDFVHSDNPKFAGKSSKERQQMALGAYYGKKKGKTRNEQADTAVKIPGQASATTGGTDLDSVRV